MVFVILVAFFLGAVLRGGGSASIPKFVSDLEKSGKKLLVRPDGSIAGVVLGEEAYQDERFGIKRRRYIMRGMDGKIHKEPRDAVNVKRGGIDDIIAIERDGGAAVTMLKNPDGGGLDIILTGQQAALLKRDSDDMEAIQRNMDRLNDQYKVMDRNYKIQQKSMAIVVAERGRLSEDLVDFRESNDTLAHANDRLSARLKGAETVLEVMNDELNRFKKRRKDSEDEIDAILKKAKEMGRVKVEMGITDEKLVPAKKKKEKPEEKPPAPGKGEKK